MDILHNETVSLRALEPEDLELLFRWENNSSIWHVSGTLVPFSKHLLRQYLENAGKDIFEQKQLRLIIELNEQARPVGAIDLFDFDPFHRRAGVGILIAGKGDRGKGYAREALDSLKEYSFKVLKLHQLWCNIGSDNQSSLRLFITAGFRIIGEKKEWNFTGRDFQDELLLQCIDPSALP